MPDSSHSVTAYASFQIKRGIQHKSKANVSNQSHRFDSLKDSTKYFTQLRNGNRSLETEGLLSPQTQKFHKNKADEIHLMIQNQNLTNATHLWWIVQDCSSTTSIWHYLYKPPSLSVLCLRSPVYKTGNEINKRRIKPYHWYFTGDARNWFSHLHKVCTTTDVLCQPHDFIAHQSKKQQVRHTTDWRNTEMMCHFTTHVYAPRRRLPEQLAEGRWECRERLVQHVF